MADYPAMMLWTDAYLGDTNHLTTIEHGAYLLLLMTMWRTKTKSLPNDPQLLARYARLTTGQWQRVWPRLEAFFQVDGNSITQGRLTREAEAVRRKSTSSSDNAKSRWLKEKQSEDADAMRNGCENDAIHNHNHNQRKNKQKAGSDDPAFVEFYDLYPLKKARDAAAKAYQAAVKRGTTHEQIMAGCRTYAAEKRGTEPRYIKHPATWLNQGCWLDEAEVPLLTAGSNSQIDDGLSSDERRWRARWRAFQSNGFWLEIWGPKPGEPGCQVPAIARAA